MFIGFELLAEFIGIVFFLQEEYAFKNEKNWKPSLEACV